MKPAIDLRIVVVDPPPDVAFALQRGRSDLEPAARLSRNELAFEFSLAVADLESEPPRLTGDFARGPPGQRFVYVNSGVMAGQAASCWTRRAKVPLSGIRRAQLEQLVNGDGLLLEARIRGTSKDGGPACASVPLLSEWTVRPAACGPLALLADDAV